MSSKEGAKLLEESTEKRIYGSTSSPGPSTKVETDGADLTESAPEVLEPSKDKSPSPKPDNQSDIETSDSPSIIPGRSLVTSSCSESSRDPTSSHNRLNEGTDERLACTKFKNAATLLRKSAFIFVFQVLFSLMPLSEMVMGIIFVRECIGSKILAPFCAVTGLFGIVFSILWLCFTCDSRHGRSRSDVLKLLSLASLVLYAVFIVICACLSGLMSVSFDEHSVNYCNATFYNYTLYKHIGTVVAAFLAGVLYLPVCF